MPAIEKWISFSLLMYSRVVSVRQDYLSWYMLIYSALLYLFRYLFIFRKKCDALSWLGSYVMPFRVSSYSQDLVGKMKDAAKSLEKATQM